MNQDEHAIRALVATWMEAPARVGGGASRQMRGPALSVLHREPDGRWVIFRDANMVTPIEAPTPGSSRQGGA